MDLDISQLIDALPALMWTASPDGHADYLSQHWLEYTGLDTDEAIGAGWQEALHPDDRTTALETWFEYIQRGAAGQLEARLRRHDGEYRWFNFRFSPLTDSSGRIVKWCGINTDVEDLKRAEAAAQTHERRFRAIIDGLPVGVTLATPDGGLEYGNQQINDYLGVTLDELRALPIADRVHPEDRAEVERRWRHSVETGNPYNHAARVKGADGVHRWYHTRGFPLHDPDGHVALWYVLQENVEDQRCVDDALRASERNLQLSIDTTPAMIWSSDADGTTESVNQHFLDYVGFSREELREETWSIAIHPDDYGALVAAWNGLRATGSPGHAEARLRRHDGEYRWFLLRTNPLHDADGNIVKWYGVNIDIEDLKRAEAELSRRAALLHQGEAVSETGSFLWRIDTNELRWSDQLCRIFEYEPGTPMTLERISARVHPEDMPLLQDMVEHARAGRDFEYQHRLLMPDGSVKHLHLVAYATRDAQGRIEFVGASQDVTDRRLSEQALSRVRSELAHVARVASLGALTASIAHEVNQPLAGIITNASTCLRMLAADPPNIAGALETARRTIRDGNRASEVIARLRTLFAKKSASSEALDLNEAAREVLALSMSELQRNDVVVRQEFSERLPPAMGDRVQIQQVILNLILNAADAMSEVRDRPRQLLIATAHEGTQEVRLSVSDSGIGIDPQNFQALFEAFYTTKSHGMGMGLSISRSIIDSHGGRLWADANDGPGATFSFALPCGF